MFVYLVYYFWLWWASHCSGSPHRGAQTVGTPASVAVVCALWGTGSVAGAHALSCFAAYGGFSRPGVQPVSLEL